MFTATPIPEATSAVAAPAPTMKSGKLTVESATPTMSLMLSKLVTDVAKTGAANDIPAIIAEPAIAANFLNCIFFYLFFYFIFCAVYAHFLAPIVRLRAKRMKSIMIDISRRLICKNYSVELGYIYSSKQFLRDVSIVSGYIFNQK
jgi:hypothetical protein